VTNNFFCKKSTKVAKSADLHAGFKSVDKVSQKFTKSYKQTNLMNMKTCKSGKSAYFRQVFVFNFLCIYTTFFNGLELKIPEAFF
jgi:hypothetical protein